MVHHSGDCRTGQNEASELSSFNAVKAHKMLLLLLAR